MLVYLVIYDQSSLDYSSRLFTDVKEYIDANYIEAQEEQAMQAASEGDVTISGTVFHAALERGLLTQETADRISAHRRRLSARLDDLKNEKSSTEKRNDAASLEKMLERDSRSFGDILAEMIKERGLKNSEVYKAANVTKQTFSNIMKSKNPPRRETVAAFAIGMKLTVPEAEKLYEAAGYAMTMNNKPELFIDFEKNKKPEAT